MSELRFYVYVIHDPRPGCDDVPVYVGKGQGRRALSHLGKGLSGAHTNRMLRGIVQKSRAFGLLPRIEIVGRFEVEIDAFALEIQLIAKYGRRNLGTGTLCNLTNGGEGGSGSVAVAERGRQWMTKLHSDSQFREAHAERLRQKWNDFDFRKQNLERLQRRHADPTFQEANSERLRRVHSNPVWVEALRAGSRRAHMDPEKNAARIAGLKRKFSDPVFREQHAERLRRRNLLPENAERMRKYHAARRDALTREADGAPSTIAGAVADTLTELP